MQAITFLGAGRAYETAYVMPDGREHVAPFCGVALARFYPDLDIHVLVTPEARAMHLAAFTKLVEDYAHSVHAVDIPIGRDEAEFWQIFETVIDLVDARQQVIFDITHGFRSLPFLSFLAAAYLRTVKEVNLHAVLYGNFEARDQSVTPHRAPVIDLTPFVSLLDWMVAADRFTRFGDARDLAGRLRAARPQAQSPAAPTDAERAAAMRLSRAANALEQVSQALRLIRPLEALTAAAALPGALEAVRDAAAYARPFMPLTRQVADAYAPLALPAADRAPIVDQLLHERRLVHWYLDHGQYAQALAAAREWIVTWLLAQAGYTDQSDPDARRVAEATLGYAVQQRNPHSKATAQAPAQRFDLDAIPAAAAAVNLYDRLGDLRNDMLHAGKRRGARSAATLAKQILTLGTQLDTLPTDN